MAQRYGLRVFLWLCWRRHQPVATNLFRNTTAIYPFLDNLGWNLETAMATRPSVHKAAQGDRSGKTVFCLYVPGAHHAPHQCDAGVDKKISDMHLFR